MCTYAQQVDILLGCASAVVGYCLQQVHKATDADKALHIAYDTQVYACLCWAHVVDTHIVYAYCGFVMYV